jgi:hypothetical protein
MKLQSSKFQEDGAHIRAVSGHMLPDIDRPFCREADVSMFMGKIALSTIVGDEELCDQARVSLVGFMCARSHLFFVLESDLALAVASSAA